jgi:hypothetical protein
MPPQQPPTNKSAPVPKAVPTTKELVERASTPAVAYADYRSRYLDEIAPAGIAGRLSKFSKEGTFVTSDDGKPIPDTDEFVGLCDQTLVGWIKFNGEGEPPDKIMGLLYDNFIMPQRETLGDLDESKWDMGLDGTPQDPWQHTIYLVLQNVATAELLTFSTSSKTGRRAVGNLLRHYDRMKRTHPDDLPRVRLSAGGFEHKDSRIGWVATPLFVVVGRSPRDDTVSPEPTTTAAYLNDDISDVLK